MDRDEVIKRFWELDIEFTPRQINALKNLLAEDGTHEKRGAEMIIPTSRNDYTAGFADGYRQGKKDAERKKGRWLDDHGNEKKDGYGADCSVCGWWSEYLTDFCGNCGADMRGGEGE